MDHITLTANQSGPVRRERFMGREHVVVPAVLVREQVLNNNLGATFLPREEITDQWAATANGAPVIIDHPSKNGQPISARSPGVVNSMGGGWLFNVRAENGELKGDVFLDPARRSDVADLDVILSRIDEGKPVELSTGFPLRSIEKTPGVHNGRAYDVVIRPAGFDHLAVFAAKKGACSVEDGCGLGVNCNCQEDPMDEQTANRFTQAIEKLMAFLSRKETTMENREQAINEVAEATGLDPEHIGSLDDERLTALHERVTAEAEAEEATEPDRKPASNADDTEPPAWFKPFADKVTELEEAAAPAINEHRTEHTRLVKALAANDRCPFGESELEPKGLEELRKLDAMAANRNYSGRGGPRSEAVDANNVDLGFEVTDWHQSADA